ncbi:MAG: hypothetical protein RL189_332 [Pseudomonadota bacterium]|jgi:predicted solute-binding protein
MTTQSFAAVAYLNMLPFFADDASIRLYPTPRTLNSEKPQCNAYCSSLIAGLSDGNRPLTSQLGVFSSGAVQSVFIEPVIHSETHAKFWKQLEEFWSHRHPSPAEALRDSETHGRIVLRSSGASEQSVWMLKVLSALGGFSIEVLIDSPSTPPSTSSASNGEKKPPEARLWIGDPALERRLQSPDAYRIDLGQVWNTHMGHRAWFAGWFTPSAQVHHTSQTVAELYGRIKVWQQGSEFFRWCAIHKFLQLQDSPLLKQHSNDGQQLPNTGDEQHWDIRDALSDYFACLEFTVSEEEGKRLLEFYLELHKAFGQWQAAQDQKQSAQRAASNTPRAASVTAG